MKKLVVVTLLLSPPVFGNQWNVIAYECEQLAIKKEPAKCKIEPGVSGPNLTVTILATQADPKETRKRAIYVAESAIYRFTSLGGKWITEQAQRKEGTKIERSCARVKGSRHRVACHDWVKRDWQ